MSYNLISISTLDGWNDGDLMGEYPVKCLSTTPLT